MRIGIDARLLGPEVTRGIGRYIQELISALLKIAPQHQYILITRTAEHAFAQHPSVETLVADIPWYGIAEQLKMPAILRSAYADVIHVPHWNVPLCYRQGVDKTLVVTIHDLLLRHAPASAKLSTRNFITRSLKRLGYRLTLDHAISEARRILVPTKFVADEILNFYPRAASKLVITGEGMPSQADNSRQTTEDRQLPTTFLLYVGSAYPHKRLEDLIAAWKLIQRAHPTLQLLLAGEMDVFMQRIKSLIKNGQPADVVFLGRVSDAKLQNLYRHALALVYPSQYEGFGLPPLEALAQGCPVIASDAPALREILGPDGARFFHVGDVNGIIAAVEDVLHQPAAARQDALHSAQALTQRHSWKLTAERTLETYYEIADNNLHAT